MKNNCQYFVFIFSVLVCTCHGIIIQVPINYTALSGDLEVHVHDLSPSEELYYLQLLEYFPSYNHYTIIGSTPLIIGNETNSIYKAKFPCGIISQGGRYGVQLHVNMNNDVSVINEEESNLKKSGDKFFIMPLDVRWPAASLALEPQNIETYPETTVSASVMFQKSHCDTSIGSLVPETWISLFYCGHSSLECKLDNVSHATQVLYSEQIRGYPSLRTIDLRCQYFGQAGYYTLILTSGKHCTGSFIAEVLKPFVLKARWSEKFVFNVHTRSIFQCDAHGGGVEVLFTYPECILSHDKVRLYGRLRADVSTLLPPTTLHYITEQKVTSGKYSLRFDCELFSERYVEYCFVYVNQAITGAVSDVRMDCVPTFPISDKDAGQWGSWSEWSACSTTCKGGIRSRYRFCDSPSPKYGAKYCEGHTVETEECGNVTSWECQLYNGLLIPEIIAEKPEIKEVVGEKCQCGCVIHLDIYKPQRFLAVSLKKCSGKRRWKIQAEKDHTIQLYINQIHFPCLNQKLKIHDGEYLTSNLLAQFTSANILMFKNFSIMTSGSSILIEYTIPDSLSSYDCGGGFVCHFRQKANAITNITAPLAEGIRAEIPFGAVHIAIGLIMLVAIATSSCMILQYMNRYYKYQRASMDDDTDHSECSSKRTFISIASHVTSTTTMISEAIPMKNYSSKTNLNMTEANKNSTESDEESAEGKNMLPKMEMHNNGEAKVKLDSQECPVPADVRVQDSENIDLQRSNADETKITDNLQSRRISVGTCVSATSSISPTPSNQTNTISSPNSSTRSLTLKRVKNLRNQQQIMNSDLSLTGHDTDLEMDYYDYNVQNTNTVPGSYLGMDPVYCVWIPPLGSDQWSEDDGTRSDSIEMHCIRPSTNNEENKDEIEDGLRSETPGEKFQKECKNAEQYKERFKRYSDISSTSSDNRTLVPDDLTPDDNLTIQDALLPDSPVEIHKAHVIKEVDSARNSLVKNDFKFADDEDDSDDAYDSDKCNRSNCNESVQLYKETNC